MKIRNSAINKISDILNEEVLNKNSYQPSIKKAVAFGFWKNITGQRFADFSKPYDIKGKTLFVSVKNPVVMQELIFYKTELLSKLQNYFLPIGIQIEEVRYDYKSWGKVAGGKDVLLGDEAPEYFNEDDMKEVSLNKFEEDEIKKATNSISKLEFLDKNLKEKLKSSMINSLKAQKIRN